MSFTDRILCHSEGPLNLLPVKLHLEDALDIMVDSLHQKPLIQLSEGLNRHVLKHSGCHVCPVDLLFHCSKHLLDRVEGRSVLRERERHELSVFEELPDRFLQVKLGVVEDEDKSSSDSVPLVSMVLFKSLL